jgi:hypothetical protein
VVLAVLAAAMAAPGAELAPSVEDVRAELALLTSRIEAADAFGEAVGLLHNRFAEGAGPPGDEVPCDAPVVTFAARSAAFGAGWRDAAQLVRESRDRVVPWFDAPTAAPLLGDDDRTALAALVERVRRHERGVLEASDWHARHLAGLVERCALRPTPADGIPRDRVVAAGEDPAPPVAVLIVGSGVLCIDATGVRGPTLAIVPSGRACYGPDDACTCDRRPVAPAAVFGDTTTNAP